MRSDMTLGELKTYCAERVAKYGIDDCCEHCEFSKFGCVDPPDHWELEDTNAARPDEELHRLRIIVSTVETILGRKFDV